MDLPEASNRQCTLLRKLNRKKYRYEEKLFLLEGVRAVQQVLKNDAIPVKTLFFDEEQKYWLTKEWKKVITDYDSSLLAADLFAEVSDTDTPQGVLALCEMPDESSVEQMGGQGGLILALDAVQDPGNLGTVIRTATWFGAAGLISGKGTVDLFHPKVVRSTAGATGVLPYINGELPYLLDEMENLGWPVFLLDAGSNSMALSEVSSFEKAVVVVGNEAHGVDGTLEAAGRNKLRIPSPQQRPGVESLNAAVAASIALYDLSQKVHSD